MTTSTLKAAFEKVCLKEYRVPKTYLPHFFSLSHRRRMREIIDSCDNSGRTTAAFSFRMVKIAVLVVILSAATILGGGAAIRREGFIVERTNVANIYMAADAADAPEYLEDYYTITYIPEGFVFSSEDSIIDETSNYRNYCTDYEDEILDRTLEFSFDQVLKDDCRIYIDNEHSIHTKISVNGHPGVYVDCTVGDDDGKPWGVLIWDNGDYILSIHGDLDKNELMKIAKSTKIEEN